MESSQKRSKRAKLASALRWLAPSIAAAGAGAATAGVWEALGMDGVIATAAAAGFVALVALPILGLASVVVRGLWHGWQPRELALVEPDGSAPRLAGWVAMLWLGTLALAWVMFQGTWVLAAMTAFKPLSMSLLEPVLAVTATLVLVSVSRPVARGFGWLAARVDARWRKRFTRPLVTPWSIVIGTLAVTATATYLIWRVLVKPRVVSLDLSVLYAPVAGLAATLIVHAVWSRLGRARRAVGGALAGAALALIVVAVGTWRLQPATTLSIWGERPIAGLAIDRLLDLDAIRARVSLAAFRPVEKPGSSHPDIVLITIDTVRADRTPPYGGPAEMPLLRELAARGIVFEWAYAPSNVTRRSIPSMLTGLAPNRVRGRVVGWALRVDPRHVLLPERLLAGGYDTAGFVCCYGFWGPTYRTGLQRGLDHLVIEPNGMKLAQQARAWLEARETRGSNKPLFLWMHLLEPHNWQSGTGQPRDDEERKRFYDRSLTAADAMMVELLGAFKNRSPEAAPIVVVSADHGEALGEHGQPYHSTDLYNSQIRVPFVIAGPGIKPSRVMETVSLTDLTPTILELAGFELPRAPAMDGRSLADFASGKRTSTDDGGIAFAAMIKDRSNPGGVTALVRGGWKLIDSGGAPELYHVHADPDEKSNLATARPELFQELKRLLEQHVAAGAKSPFE